MSAVISMSAVNKYVSMSVDDKGYRRGTRHGQLQHHYPRTSFTVLHENFLSPTDVPSSSTPLSLREAATAEAIGRGHTGRIFCKCEKGCASNRCRCLFTNLKCNSKCHGSKPCLNK